MSTIDDLDNAMARANTAIAKKVKGKAAEAFLSDDALKMGGWTKEQYVTEVTGAIAPHVNDMNNPHHTTAASIQAYTIEEINVLLAQRIPMGFLPLTRFGEPDAGGQDVPPAISVTSNPPVLTIAATKAMINGSSYSVPQTVLPLLAGARNYIYFGLTAGVAGYRTSSVYIPESSTSTWIGDVGVTGQTVTSAALIAVQRLGVYRVSNTARGSSISVSNGNPADAATLAWT